MADAHVRRSLVPCLIKSADASAEKVENNHER